jgi:hypothetical protein
MKKIFFLFFLYIEMFFHGNLSAADQLETTRIEKGISSLKEFKNKGKELNSSEYFLFSLKKSISQNEFLTFANQDNAQITAIHICSGIQTVTAFFFDQSLSLNIIDQINKIKNETRNIANSDFLKIPKTHPDAKEFDGGPKPISENFKICGFEAKLPLKNLEKFTLKMKNNLKLTEVINSRQRKLPISTKE